MLVLTRRAGESIVIDHKVEIKVLRIRGTQVHIGIEAPRDTPVFRREVLERQKAEGEEGPGDPGEGAPGGSDSDDHATNGCT